MTTSKMSEVIQHLRRAVLLQDGAGLTDRQLLECFISCREEAALAALVRLMVRWFGLYVAVFSTTTRMLKMLSRPKISAQVKLAYEQIARMHTCEFHPLDHRGSFDYLTHDDKSQAPMDVLYRIGFDALPPLIEALDDDTPTRSRNQGDRKPADKNPEDKKSKRKSPNEIEARLDLVLANSPIVTSAPRKFAYLEERLR